MNKYENDPLREKKPLKMTFLLWIMITSIAAIGCYFANYALIFHLKSSLMTWFGAWFAFFGLSFQFWTGGISIQDQENGPYSISATPNILGEVLMITGLFLFSLNTYFFIAWIFSYPFYYNYRSPNTAKQRIKPNYLFLKHYKEPKYPFDFKVAVYSISKGFLLITTSFLIVDLIREFSIKKTITPNIETLILFSIAITLNIGCILIPIKIENEIKR